MEKNKKGIISKWTYLLKKSFERLKKNDPLHLAGSTAFFAVFSIAPIIIIIIQILGLIFSKDAIREALLQQVSETVPAGTVDQLRNMLEGLNNMADKWYVAIGGFVFLMFSASTLFKVIETSLLRLWRLRRTNNPGFLFQLKNRLFSVFMIIGASLLLVVGLMGEGIQAFLGDYLAEISPAISFYFQSVFKHIISILIATAWFAIVYRFLSEARPQWKTVIVGALFTSFLFTAGKLLLHVLLGGSNLGSVYGASASLVLLLLFIFYISLVIYYGAAFTIEWGKFHNQRIKRPSYLSYYKLKEERSSEEEAE
jgi:membrane protein